MFIYSIKLKYDWKECNTTKTLGVYIIQLVNKIFVDIFVTNKTVGINLTIKLTILHAKLITLNEEAAKTLEYTECSITND